jgi:hypothetical protein
VLRVISAHLQEGADEFAGGQVSFDRARFTDGKLVLSTVRFLGSEVSFNGAEFSDTSKVFFIGADLTGGEVSFDVARFAPSSEVSFFAAKFSGTQVHFYETEFAGGDVDFASVSRWSRPPEFDFGRPPPGVKLPEPPFGES